MSNKEHVGTSYMGVTPLRRNAEIQKFSAVTGTRRAYNFFFRYFWDVKKKNTELIDQACRPIVTHQLLQLGVWNVVLK